MNHISHNKPSLNVWMTKDIHCTTLQTYHFRGCDLLTLWIGKSKGKWFQQVAGSSVHHLDIVYHIYRGLIFLQWLCDVYLWCGNPTTWNITMLINSLFRLSGYHWDDLCLMVNFDREYKDHYILIKVIFEGDHNAFTLTSDFKVMYNVVCSKYRAFTMTFTFYLLTLYNITSHP